MVKVGREREPLKPMQLSRWETIHSLKNSLFTNEMSRTFSKIDYLNANKLDYLNALQNQPHITRIFDSDSFIRIVRYLVLTCHPVLPYFPLIWSDKSRSLYLCWHTRTRVHTKCINPSRSEYLFADAEQNPSSLHTIYYFTFKQIIWTGLKIAIQIWSNMIIKPAKIHPILDCLQCF